MVKVKVNNQTFKKKRKEKSEPMRSVIKCGFVLSWMTTPLPLKPIAFISKVEWLRRIV